MSWLSYRRTTKVQAAVTKNMALASVRDVGGYEFGVIWQPQFRQGSILLAAEEGLSRDMRDTWRSIICGLDSVVAVTTIMSSGGTDTPYAVVTFDSADYKRDDFLTWLAIRLVPVYSPESLDAMWLPQSPSAITAYASSLWAPDSGPVFPPVAQSLQENHLSIQCDRTHRIAFGVLLDEHHATDIVQALEDVVATSEPASGETIHFVHITRPLELQHRDQSSLLGFRGTGVIVLSASSLEQCEDFAADFISSLSAHTRLRLTRLFGRQHLGVLLAGGLPTYGWQHSDVFVRK